jgi:hypothetical protein
VETLTESENDKDLGPGSSVSVMSIDAPSESLETTQNDQDQTPSVPQGEWDVNNKLLQNCLRLSGFRRFDAVVDLRYGGRDEKGEDEGGDIPCKRGDSVFSRLVRFEKAGNNEQCLYHIQTKAWFRTANSANLHCTVSTNTCFPLSVNW